MRTRVLRMPSAAQKTQRVYQIFLINVDSARNDKGGLTIAAKTETANALQDFFDQVIKSSPALTKTFSGSSATWQNSCSMTIGDDELLIYFVPSGCLRLVHKMPDSAQASLIPEGNGLTNIGKDMCASEVYLAGGNAQLWARIAFHESLHNKQRKGDTMHTNADGLAAAQITDTTSLSTANKQAMAGKLTAKVKQWLGGCSAYQPNDPLFPSCAF